MSRGELFLDAFRTGYSIADRAMDKRAEKAKNEATGQAYASLGSGTDMAIPGQAQETPGAAPNAIPGQAPTGQTRPDPTTADPERQYVNVQTWNNKMQAAVDKMAAANVGGDQIHKFIADSESFRNDKFQRHSRKALALLDIDPDGAARELRAASSYNTDGVEWIPKIVNGQLVVGARDDITGQATTKPRVINKETLSKMLIAMDEGPKGLKQYDLLGFEAEKAKINLDHLDNNHQLSQLKILLDSEKALAGASKELEILNSKITKNMGAGAEDLLKWEGAFHKLLKEHWEISDTAIDGDQVQNVARVGAAIGRHNRMEIPVAQALSTATYISPLFDRATAEAKALVAQEAGVNPADPNAISLSDARVAEKINNTRMAILVNNGVFMQDHRSGQWLMQTEADSEANLPVPPALLGQTPLNTFTGNGYSIMSKVASGGYPELDGMRDVIDRMRNVLGMPTRPMGEPQRAAPISAPQKKPPTQTPTKKEAARPGEAIRAKPTEMALPDAPKKKGAKRDVAFGTEQLLEGTKKRQAIRTGKDDRMQAVVDRHNAGEKVTEQEVREAISLASSIRGNDNTLYELRKILRSLQPKRY